MSDMVKSGGGGNGKLAKTYDTDARFQGMSQDDIVLPRVHLFQGLPAEREKMGKLDEGTLVNSLTGDVLATPETVKDFRFIPIMVYKEYIKFKEPRGAGIEYRTRNKEEVDPSDLEFADGRSPECTEFINWVILPAGTTEAIVLPFKSTGLRQGKTLYTLEKGRGGKGPGLYGLSLKDEKNAKGAWKSLVVRPCGNPSIEDAEVANGLIAGMAGVTVSTEQTGDDIPI